MNLNLRTHFILFSVLDNIQLLLGWHRTLALDLEESESKGKERHLGFGI